jgi:uncharacterized membrane protein
MSINLPSRRAREAYFKRTVRSVDWVELAHTLMNVAGKLAAREWRCSDSHVVPALQSSRCNMLNLTTGRTQLVGDECVQSQCCVMSCNAVIDYRSA